jgi:DNA-directed RNA polymerase subunit beta'
MLKGKKGRFRRNLLGKRVDYSGRSVIVVGPQLKIHQCGLPKTMALELYRPFVIARLVKNGFANNVKGAKRFIERNRPEVWEVLEDVIKDRPVLLNRAPTLHRLGIQAFEPILIEGSAIQLHPLVTTAFNADFDGDQMAVHVPLSQKAVQEARDLMLSSRNLLKPADGEPIISPSKDMVLGVYYLTYIDQRTPLKTTPPQGKIFTDMNEVEMVYSIGQAKIHDLIYLNVETWYDEKENRLDNIQSHVIQTTVGRVIFNRILPPELRFVNRVLDKGGIKDLVADIYEYAGPDVTTQVIDRIKDIGFTYATRSGHTIAISDVNIPKTKVDFVNKALDAERDVQKAFRRGLLTAIERDERLIKIWQDTTIKVGEEVKKAMDPNGNLATMANSGATKGGFGPISQMAGMRGLMADPSGRIIPLPIRSNFREGLTALEYFISTHGARKGLADTALRTADAGYLTRRLVDIAQDMIINDDDCFTEDGIWMRRSDNVAGQSFESRLYGRTVAQRVADPDTGEILIEKNEIIEKEQLRRIRNSKVQEIKVRSPLTCELVHGMCAKCYGLDLGRGKLVEMGTAVGIVAAQSIGEPGTQLTLRTFHSGGVAAGGDITTGLPRVEELLEARKTPKGEASVAEIAGTVHILQNDRYSNLRVVRVEQSQMISEAYDLPVGWSFAVEDGSEVKEGQTLAISPDQVTPVAAQHGGRVRIEDNQIIVSHEQSESKDHDIPSGARLIVKDGDHVEPGHALTEGSLNPHKILQLQGREACQTYLLNEVQKVYRSQGQNINDKHFEIILRKMMSKVQITRPGDTGLLPHDLVSRLELRRINEQMLSSGKHPSKFAEVLLGITKASLSTDSFLSASSFQHTIKVLAGAAISSSEDPLFGLKENVIIGKLIPAGTGFVPGRFDTAHLEGELADAERAALEDELDELDDELLDDLDDLDEPDQSLLDEAFTE